MLGVCAEPRVRAHPSFPHTAHSSVARCPSHSRLWQPLNVVPMCLDEHDGYARDLT